MDAPSPRLVRKEKRRKMLVSIEAGRTFDSLGVSSNEEEGVSIMDDVQLERPAKRDVDDRLPWAGSVLELACECGRSGCGEVIALPWSVYEQAKREPRRSLLVPGHELAGVGRALSRYDSFVVVAKV
jgi:hypothetical protein